MFQIQRLQDIQLSDLTLKQDYYNEFFNGNISTAKAIVTDNPQLASKVLSAENLNNLVNSILSLENDYWNETEVKFTELSAEFQLSVDELIYMTPFSELTQYEVNNFVVYGDYLCYCKVQPPIGTLPTDTNYWVNLYLKGQTGDPSLGVHYAGAWSSIPSYVVKDMVVYNGVVYIANTANTNEVPSLLGSWSEGASIQNQGIYVSTTVPTYASVAEIYMALDETWLGRANLLQNVYVNESLATDTAYDNDFLFQTTGYTRTTPVAIYVSKTTPVSSLAIGDLWMHIPDWSVNTERELQGLYIYSKYPNHLAEGTIWIEIFN